MDEKHCNKCGITKSVSEFPKNKNRKSGLGSNCKECVKLNSKQYYEKNKDKVLKQTREYKKKNKEYLAEKQKEWDEKNREKIRQKTLKWKQSEKGKEWQRQYYRENKNYIDQINKEWKEKNKERFKYLQKRHYESNKYLYRLKDFERNYKIKQAKPDWLTEQHINEIKEIYKERRRLSELTGIEFNVDHIIPLQNKFVCGLHVPWNMQILPYYKNARKSNKLILGEK